jgi:all-trans-retinol 13,14-reductase
VLLAYPCLLYGTPPEDALFSTHALVAGSYYRSVHAIEGGGAAVTRAFQARLDALGVEVLCGDAVEGVRVTPDGAFSGVVLSNGEEVPGECCIWSAHPKTLIRAAPAGALRRPFRQRIEQLEETTSALMLFGQCESRPAELDRRNLILWPGGDFSNKLAGREAMAENVIMLFAGSGEGAAKVPVTAMAPTSPAGFMPWSESRPGKRPPEYDREKRRVLEEFQSSLQGRCSELAKKVNFFEGATPLTLRDYCLAPGGGLYGVRHSISQFNPQPLTRIRGLLLCGQSIVAPGILGAVVSAYLVCGFVLGHEELHRQLQEVV